MHQAADALVAEGLRPTIERVRQKIGRGSPNTVSPMLDDWFATLAGRLGLEGAKQEGEQLPEPVQLAASVLWQAALLAAREEAAQALEQAHQVLTAERMDLAQKTSDFEHHQQTLLARQLAADEALQLARSELSDKTIRLEEASLLLNRRESDIDALRDKLAQREAERDANLRRSEEQNRDHAEERARLEARATANERRWLEELDRERQEAKRLKAAVLEHERRTAAAHAKLQADNLSLAGTLQEKEHDLKVAQQALASANLRVREMSDVLEAQKSAQAITLKQLDLLLIGSSRKTLASPVIRRRRRL
ncbi:MAG: DNA-binding protein [Pseudomonadota bacterium]|nr:DNA-binding protein [Pseudomonadota bacterium]